MVRLNKNLWRRAFSGLITISLLVNSLLPYSAGMVYGQDITTSITPLPTESLSVSPTPDLTPTITVDPTPTTTPTPTPEITPTPTLEIIPTTSPETIPSPTPIPTTDPSPTPSPLLNLNTKPKNQKDLSARPKVFSNNFQEQKQDHVPNEVIVKFKREKLDIKNVIGKAQSFLFEKKFSLEKKDEILDLNIQVFKSSKSTEEMVKELKSDSNVEYAEPNYYKYPMVTPNDTNYSNLWGLHNTGQTVNSTSGTSDADIDAPTGWDLESASQTDVIVADIDSGVAYNHPDLHGNMWDGSSSCKDENNSTIVGGCPNHGWDYDKSSGSDNNPLDDDGHGTHIAGTIGAISNNSAGISGLSYNNNLKIMAVKFGYNYATTVNEIKAINFARYNGAKVINASYTSTSYSASEKAAIDAFPGLFIAAAGNNGTNNESTAYYPCNYTSSNVICVAATDQNDALASFSNYGSTSVDVGAPGVNIYSSEGYRQLYEDFEGVTPPAIGSNFTQSGSGTWGTWHFTGNNVIYGDINYPYANNADSYLTSSSYNLSGATGAYLNFLYSCITESLATDYLVLQAYNGSTWTELDRYGGNGGNEWVDANYDVSSYANSSFKFRFLWHTNGSNGNYDGCQLDDIKLINSSSTNGSYQFMNGTSMATPHVVGLAGMLFSYEPNLTNAQAKTLILNYGDSKASLSGKTVSGKRINLYNSLSIAGLPTTPVASPAGGTHYGSIYVSLTSDHATSIRYTTNGSTPSCSSTQYSSPITISATTTLKAIGCTSIESSSVMSEIYTITTPTSTWYLAEGYTGGSFATYILIQNPTASTATVDTTYMIQGENNVSKQYTVSANSRYTVYVNDEVGAGKSVSTKLNSNQNIIVERSMYWDAGGNHWAGGHESAGVTTIAKTWYLAEGYTGGSFDTYALIQNPTASTATITATYMIQGESPVSKSYTVNANSRYTVYVNDEVGAGKSVSTKFVSNQNIIVERSMYWDAGGVNWSAGHNCSGVSL